MLYYKFYIEKEDESSFSENEYAPFINTILDFGFVCVGENEYMKKEWGTIVKTQFGDIYLEFHSQAFDLEFFFDSYKFL